MAKARISSNWGAGETVKGRQAANALGVLPLAFFLMGLGCFFYDGDSTIGKFPSWKYLLPLLSGAALEFWAHLRFVRIPVFPELKARISVEQDGDWNAFAVLNVQRRFLNGESET